MKFKPSDFETQTAWSNHSKSLAAIANAILKEWLDAAPTVSGTVIDGSPEDGHNRIFTLSSVKNIVDTHSAKLLCIEKIKKECDEHWPIGSAEPYKIICQKCGVQLIQEWRAVK